MSAHARWASRTFPVLLFLLLAAAFAALGLWQLERRAWKRDLIARVERRLAASPVAAPAPAAWRGITHAHDEYRRVRVSGHFLASRDTLVTASTELGAGYWLLAPFRDARGFTVLVNRGFVPTRAPLSAAGDRSVLGLLRLTEPGGGLFISNAPSADRWYSRDIAAIARARGLGQVAPYFIDAAAEPDARLYPRGGLTVIAFANHHLLYALTWFALMLLALAAAIRVLRPRVCRDGPFRR